MPHEKNRGAHAPQKILEVIGMKFLRLAVSVIMGIMAGHFAFMAIAFKDANMWIYFFQMLVLMVLYFTMRFLEEKKQK